MTDIQPTILGIIGEALFGSRWQSELARELGVSDRTLRRWIADPDSMPPAVGAELRALCARRGQALIDLSRG